jgi:glycerol-3-phosphate dehydrogenase
MQGVDVLLATRGDFAEGATAGSSRMIHGGLRYLEQSEFRLVREALHERNRLLINAPHFVKPLRTTIPIFSWVGGLREAVSKLIGLPARTGNRGALWVKIGLSLYDWYVRKDQALPRHAFLSGRRIRQRLPEIRAEIKCAAVYHDAWVTHPERLCYELIVDSRKANPNAFALNHTPIVGIDRGAVMLRHEPTGETYRVNPRVVINATGGWIDEVNATIGKPTEYIGGTKGSHLVLNHPKLRSTLDGEILYENPDGRVCLVFPFHDRVIVGTTDVPVRSPDEAKCDDAEIKYILESVRGILPGVEIDRSHVVSHYCAVRPLPRSNAATPGQVSRDHSCRVEEPDEHRTFPVLSLVGGKWTTFRAFAEQVTDLVLARLGRDRKFSTAETPIGGGRDFPSDAAGCVAWISQIRALSELDPKRREMLLERYGTRCRDIAEFICAGSDEDIATLPGYSRREIEYIATHEDVTHLDDLVVRRLNVVLLGHIDRAAVTELATICGKTLGWDAACRTMEITRTLDILERDLGLSL